MKKIILHTDGGARGNPGHAGIGALLTDAYGTIVAEVSEYIGVATNNVAEYRALIAGLTRAASLNAQTVQCFLDSELLVRQMRREYRVKEKHLQQLFVETWNACQHFQKVTFTHIPREKNTAADSLVNRAIDAYMHSCAK